jgi:hypothetical protein
MNKIFFKGQWFAYEAPCDCHPMCKHPFQINGKCKQRSGESIEQAKANALPVLNYRDFQEPDFKTSMLIVDRIAFTAEENKDYDWPGTMKMELTEGWVPSYNDPDNSGWHSPAEPKGYILSLPETTASGDTAKQGEFPNVPNDPSLNWEEDYTHENGKYQNKCYDCGKLFFGRKRRPVCKVCGNKPPDWEKMAEKKVPTQHEGWAWQGCWADGEMTGFARCMVQKVKPLEEENARLRKLVEKAFNEGFGEGYSGGTLSWEQFKKDNGL